MKRKYKIITTEDAVERRKNLTGYVAGDTLLMADCVIAILAHLTGPVKTAKRKPTPWNQFFGKHMKAGLTPKEIAEKWRRRNGK